MKKLIHLLIFIFFTYQGISQDINVEKVNWDSLQSYHADQIMFKSEEIKMQCTDCNFVEITTISGITGIFMFCKGTVNIKKGNISDTISGCMIRFNPADINIYITIENKTKIKDKGFIAVSKNILNDSFNHCYHSNKDAIIPDKGAYALNLFSKSFGEILASYARDTKVLFNFTENKQIN